MLVAMVALLVGSVAGAEGPLPDRPHIYVEGRHTESVQADRYEINVSMTEVAETSSVAASAVAERLAVVLEQVRTLGVPNNEVAAFDLHVEPAYEWKEGNRYPVGTRVARHVRFTLHDLGRTQELLDALVRADIAEITETRAYSSREDELRATAAERAVQHARERAERIAGSLGARLGNVHSVSEFELRYEPSVLHRLSGAPAQFASRSLVGPFRPGPVEITGRAFVVFLLKQ